ARARSWRARRPVPSAGRRSARRARARRATASSAPCRSPPLLLPLPSALPPHPGGPHAEVELLDVLLLREVGAGVLHDDAPHLQHVAEFGDRQRHVRVLLDEQDGGAALP